MQRRTFTIGPLDTNCYLVYAGKEAVVIDPGGSPKDILAFLDQEDLTLTHVLLTHLHFDHVYGVSELAKTTGARVLASEADRYMTDNKLGKGGVTVCMPSVPDYDFEPLEPGPLALAGGECTVIATPGHSPGGLSYYFPEMGVVYSGDSLFYRAIGRTDFAGGSFKTLITSIREALFSLPDDTIVYPGHGPSTTVGDEKNNNPYSSDFAMI